MAPPPPSVNGILLDDAIRRGLYLERLKTGERNKVLAFLNTRVFPDLTARLLDRLDRIEQRGFDLGKATTARLQRIAQIVAQHIDPALVQVRDTLRESLVNIGTAEATWQAARIEAAIPAPARALLKLSLDVPPRSVIRSIVTAQPFRGKTMTEWFKDLATGTKSAITQQVKIGLIEGETVDQLVRRVRGTRALGFKDGVFETTRRHAATIVRTATAHVSARTRQETMQANDDLLAGERMLTALDVSVCPICMDWEARGPVFPVGEGPRLPLHPNDRCTVVPVVKPFKELGLSANELPEGTRASIDGQVPASTTFESWLKGQSVERQNQALGPGRAALFRAGKISLSDLVTDAGRPLTLEQLQAVG